MPARRLHRRRAMPDCRADASRAGVDMTGWDFWIDRGGTFTDIVARDPGRAAAPGEAPVGEPRAVRRRGAARHPRLPRARARTRRSRRSGCASVKMGTTVATNALLERKGEPLVLVTTQGLGAAAAARLPEPAAAVRPAHRAAGDALCPGDRGARAGARRRDRRGAARRGAPGGGAGRGAGGGARRLRHRLRARLPAPGARGAGGGAGARRRASRRSRSATRSAR